MSKSPRVTQTARRVLDQVYQTDTGPKSSIAVTVKKSPRSYVAVQCWCCVCSATSRVVVQCWLSMQIHGDAVPTAEALDSVILRHEHATVAYVLALNRSERLCLTIAVDARLFMISVSQGSRRA